MHAYIRSSDGWTIETLADESDHSDSPSTLEKELQGCCFIKVVRTSKRYTGEIRYEEQRHNELVVVEAVVFRQHKKEETTERNIHYFRRREFEGENCKRDAARYAYRRKE